MPCATAITKHLSSQHDSGAAEIPARAWFAGPKPCDTHPKSGSLKLSGKKDPPQAGALGFLMWQDYGWFADPKLRLSQRINNPLGGPDSGGFRELLMFEIG